MFKFAWLVTTAAGLLSAYADNWNNWSASAWAWLRSMFHCICACCLIVSINQTSANECSAYRFLFSALLYCRLFKHPPPISSSSLGFSPLALSLALFHTDMGCCLCRLTVQFLPLISTTPGCSITLKGTVHPKSKFLYFEFLSVIQKLFLERHKGE